MSSCLAMHPPTCCLLAFILQVSGDNLPLALLATLLCSFDMSPSFTAIVATTLGFLLLAYRWTKQRGQVVPQSKRHEATNSSDHVKPRTDFDLAATAPHPYRPWKSGKFVMTMGIRKIEPQHWLDMDNRYGEEQKLRRDLLEHHKDGVTQALPGSETACVEVLEMVVDYLKHRYPNLFFHPEGNRDYIRNEITGYTFRITTPYPVAPLEVAAQLVMEDLNIMIKGFGADPEHHYL
jgi:hypothetical protein